jgi:predicted nucleotidyltransferase
MTAEYGEGWQRFRWAAMTPYADVNATLADLLGRVRAILGSRFFGMYLYGSLAAGDFNAELSDIDFLVVTGDELPDDVVAKLARMHELLFSGGSRWGWRLEGSYLPLAAVRVFRRDDPPRLTINERRVYLDRHWSDWVIQRAILREHGVAVAGPPLQPYIDPISPDALRTAVREILTEWWASMADDPRWLERPGYQPYAVLSMCRALHTLANETILSKPAAARWALENVDRRWSRLIRDALAWRDGDRIGSVAETVELIRYTLLFSGA